MHVFSLDQLFDRSQTIVDWPEGRTLPTFDRIKAARRLVDANPAELASSRDIVSLVSEGLTESRDLQLGVWLLESLVRIQGFRGTASGLVVIRRLIDECWDGLHPLPDVDDPEPLERRRLLLEWIDERVAPIVAGVPLTAAPASFSFLHFEVTQKTGEERRALLEGGWPTAERFVEALAASPLPFLAEMVVDISACESELGALHAAIDRRFPAVDRVVLRRLAEILESSRSLLERNIGQRGTTVKARAIDGRAAPAKPCSNADDTWSQAVALTRENRVDGLRMMQAHVAVAACGRDRFLRQLQLAELAFEAGLHALAYPHFDELAKMIDTRQLEGWEDPSLLARVWTGVVRCCDALDGQATNAQNRKKEIVARIIALGAAYETLLQNEAPN